ncbi:hypothetical protein N656DRAFT_848963 [Canariomyces notabilis]|uniref:Uncharacterized protein n=1 Tax=Canariomyces notabilis TaxID=2074819 RepID=A0AAN6QDA9_9PEZI|nr:hypothetical protein N656DRAFT_848963 [Canariomyces arenarius]
MKMLLLRSLATFIVEAKLERPHGCGTLSTVTVTVTPSSTSTGTSTTSDSTITSYPDSCTYRPTQTYYASSGCAFSCSSQFCIIDAPATISCGCPTVFIETQTVTVCPTKSPCWNCHTGWGTFLVTETCTSTATTAAVAVPTGV